MMCKKFKWLINCLIIAFCISILNFTVTADEMYEKVYMDNPRIDDNGNYSISFETLGLESLNSDGQCFVAAYNAEGKLLEVHQRQIVNDDKYSKSYKDEFTYRDDIYSFGLYLWNDMKPLYSGVKLYADNPVKIALQYEADNSVNLYLEDNNVKLKTAKILFPQNGVMAWESLMQNYNDQSVIEDYDGSFLLNIGVDRVNLTRCGEYIVYTKDENNIEGYQRVFVPVPLPTLSCEIDYKDDTAIVSVNCIPNDSAPIEQLVYVHLPGGWDSFPSGSNNYGGLEKKLIETYGDTPIENSSFEVYENNMYAVIAIDAWGNTAMEIVEITDL